MSYKSGGIATNAQFSLNSPIPLDSRFVIANLTEYNALVNETGKYPGLRFTVSDDLSNGVTAGVYCIGTDGSTITKVADTSGKALVQQITVSDAKITIDTKDGLTADGSFTLNQANAGTISIGHSNSIAAGTAQGGSGALTHGGSFTVPRITYDSQGHITGSGTTTYTLPSENNPNVSIGSASTTSGGALSHGGKLTVITALSSAGHTITPTLKEYTLPAETELSGGSGATNDATVVGGVTVSNHAVAVAKKTISSTTNELTVTGTTSGISLALNLSDYIKKEDIDKLSSAMVFKGTLGTGGTVTSVPSNPKIGDTYKVITAGTYAAIACTVGDMLTYSSSSTWVHIPSGDDEYKGTVTSISAGTDIVCTPNPITSTGSVGHVAVSRSDGTVSDVDPGYNGTFTVVDSITTSSTGHVTSVKTKTVSMPDAQTFTDTNTSHTHSAGIGLVGSGSAGITGGVYTYKTKLRSETALTVDSAAATTVSGRVYPVVTDKSGYLAVNVPWQADTDLKAASGDTSSKIYLIGATSQSASGQTTYSHNTAYVGSDGHLYSNSAKVLSTSYAPEAYLTWGGKNFAGDWGPIDAAMVPDFAANRFAFLPPEAVTLEYSTNSGSTWTELSSDSIKKGLFSTESSFAIGNSTTTNVDKSAYMCRITITTTGYVYSALNKFAIKISSNGSTGCYCKLESRTKANQTAGNNTWVTNIERAELQGWTGYNILNTDAITTHGNNDSQYSQLRFTFGVDSHASSLNYTGLQVVKIMAFGGEGWKTCSNMAKDGHLYSYDANQSATFPASITATNITATSNGKFYGNGSKLTNLNASNISSGTLNANILATSGVTAGSYGPSENATPGHSGSFSVPYITVDTKGRVTAASTKTITLPENTYPNSMGCSCTTAAATAAKAAIASGFTLVTGTTIFVKFTNAHTSGTAATLNINNTGAKTITRHGKTITSSNANSWLANQTVQFVYDGTYWRYVDLLALTAIGNVSATTDTITFSG